MRTDACVHYISLFPFVVSKWKMNEMGPWQTLMMTEMKTNNILTNYLSITS